MIKRAIEPAPQTPGFSSRMFVIPKRSGGHRPVFNLRALNQFVVTSHFKMETLQQVVKLIQPNDYLTSIDLSDAFLHILVHQHSRLYLRFRLEGKTFQFRTTTFGLSVVPWLFTRLTKPILTWARSQGIRLAAYLDDWNLMAPSPEEAATQTASLINLMKSLGWLVNYKKSHLQPCQELKHLGFRLDTKTMTIRLPAPKIRDLRRSIRVILDKPAQPPRLIRSLTMRIRAATLAIFPTNLYTQALMFWKNSAVRSSADWDTPRSLSPECIQELQWWYKNLHKWNGRSMMPQSPAHTIHVDASNKGWGGVYQGQVVHGRWTQEEAKESINWRELKAIQLTLQAFPHLQDTTILFRSDNTTATAYVNKQGGTRSQRLSHLATDIWEKCLDRRLQIRALHIPGKENIQADFASRRFYKKNTWNLHPSIFQQIQQRWGPHDVDLFADHTTNLLPRYVSWKTDPMAIAMDAMTIPWTKFSNPYLNPPWNMIQACLKKILLERIHQATIVVPFWPSAVWFPMLKALSTTPPLLFDPAQVVVHSALSPWTNPRWRLSVWQVSSADLSP